MTAELSVGAIRLEADPEVRRARMAALALIKSKVYPFEECRHLYVEGRANEAGHHVWPTLMQLAAELGIPERRVFFASSRGGWPAARQVFKDELAAVVRARKVAALADGRLDLDVTSFDTARRGQRLVRQRVEELLTRHDQQLAAKVKWDEVLAANGSREELEATGYDPYQDVIDERAIAALATAERGWLEVGHRALGDTDTHRVEVTGALEMRHSVVAELERDSPDRVLDFVGAIARAVAGSRPAPGGVLELTAGDEDDDDIVDVEIVEE